MASRFLAASWVAAAAFGLLVGPGCGSPPNDVLVYGHGNGGGPGGPGGPNGGVNSGGPNGPGGPGGGGDGGGGVVDAGPTMTAQQALGLVGGCMAYTDFTGTGLIDMPKSQTLNAGPCLGCHNHGEDGMWASWGTVGGVDTSMEMFQKTQTMPYVTMYIAAVVDNGKFTGLSPSGAIANKASLAATCVPSAQNNNWCHPQFAFEPQVQQSIDDYTTKALTKWQNNQCAAPPPQDAGAPPGDAGDGGG